jgi:hypothetical protein
MASRMGTARAEPDRPPVIAAPKGGSAYPVKRSRETNTNSPLAIPSYRSNMPIADLDLPVPSGSPIWHRLKTAASDPQIDLISDKSQGVFAARAICGRLPPVSARWNRRTRRRRTPRCRRAADRFARSGPLDPAPRFHRRTGKKHTGGVPASIVTKTMIRGRSGVLSHFNKYIDQ